MGCALVERERVNVGPLEQIKETKMPPEIRLGFGAASCWKNRSARLSLFGQDGVLHGFANAEFQCCFGRDLNCFACRGVAAFTGLSF